MHTHTLDMLHNLLLLLRSLSFSNHGFKKKKEKKNGIDGTNTTLNLELIIFKNS